MAIVITATAGAASSNSYVTEAEFIARMATRLNVPTGTTVESPDASETEKKALIEATRELDALRWKGSRVDAVQALAWPREAVPQRDLPDEIVSGTAYYYATDAVPQFLKDATAELALEFLRAGSTDISGRDTSLDIAREKVGPIETEFVGHAYRPRGLARFPRVVSLIGHALDISGVRRVVRI